MKVDEIWIGEDGLNWRIDKIEKSTVLAQPEGYSYTELKMKPFFIKRIAPPEAKEK